MVPEDDHEEMQTREYKVAHVERCGVPPKDFSAGAHFAVKEVK